MSEDKKEKTGFCIEVDIENGKILSFHEMFPGIKDLKKTDSQIINVSEKEYKAISACNGDIETTINVLLNVKRKIIKYAAGGYYGK
jgi:hypothetical protein